MFHTIVAKWLTRKCFICIIIHYSVLFYIIMFQETTDVYKIIYSLIMITDHEAFT